MSNIYYIGCDPGVNGGLAAIDQNNKVYALTKMPSLPEDIVQWFAMFSGLNTYAVLEKVTGYVGKKSMGAHMLTLGENYGILQAGLVISGVRENKGTYSKCMAHVWQDKLGLRKRTKDESDTSWKNYLKDNAQTLFPRVKVTLKTADALLIAYYCKKLYGV